ncbi:hypothetical protein FHR81_004372 [Actinoalloteichus hoggarensis]|uniref:Uncharacterized protein n=1 Tax=Actinoalloteichus hoggarensis TaxID=1470176 RepID=A0A221W9I1_9PSEU|nr:hypothetical protein [Actinoalloteichus hoggarensis]ASO22276.1 hypothetical protein AHOG_23340 [Actinoalloteichus hoggarensis]MBB5923305.1 hypothetical protein [Actinoalloteichus hoggarensis]
MLTDSDPSWDATDGRPQPAWLPRAWLALGVAGVLGLAVIAGLLLADRRPSDAEALPTAPVRAPDDRPEEGEPVEPVLSPDVLGHPDEDEIRVLVDTHFEAINGLNYELWATTVVERRVRDLPEQVWMDSYRSTTDGNVLIHRVDPGPEDSLRMVLSFVSLQDPQDAPAEVPADCVYWRVVYPLAIENGRLKLDSGLPNSSIPSPCKGQG